MRKDIDISFARHPITKDLAIKSGDSAIKQAIVNIVLTNYYERGYNVDFGTNVRSSLFENNVEGVTAQGIRANVIRSIENFEPQVEIIDVDVESEAEGHTLSVTVKYQMINKREQQQVLVRV